MPLPTSRLIIALPFTSKAMEDKIPWGPFPIPSFRSHGAVRLCMGISLEAGMLAQFWFEDLAKVHFIYPMLFLSKNHSNTSPFRLTLPFVNNHPRVLRILHLAPRPLLLLRLCVPMKRTILHNPLSMSSNVPAGSGFRPRVVVAPADGAVLRANELHAGLCIDVAVPRPFSEGIDLALDAFHEGALAELRAALGLPLFSQVRGQQRLDREVR